MARVLSIVQARRMLGAVAEDVRRGGEPVVLTRRGHPIAKIVAATTRGDGGFDALGALRGSVTLNGTFAEVQEEVRELRAAFADAMQGRVAQAGRPRRRKGG